MSQQKIIYNIIYCKTSNIIQYTIINNNNIMYNIIQYHNIIEQNTLYNLINNNIHNT